MRDRSFKLGRRQFFSFTPLIGCSGFLLDAFAKESASRRLDAAESVGQMRKENGKAPVEGATWYVADAEGTGLVYGFPPGALAKAKHLAADMLLDGTTLATFMLALPGVSQGRVFQYCFGGLNQCSLRVRMALELVDQNRLFVDCEGALLWQISSDTCQQRKSPS